MKFIKNRLDFLDHLPSRAATKHWLKHQTRSMLVKVESKLCNCESRFQPDECYTSFFSHHPHAAWSIDRHGYYRDANCHSLSMTGLTLEQLKKTHFSQVVHSEDLPILQEVFEQALGGVGGLFEGRVVQPDGQLVYIRCTVIPLIINGEIIGAHGVTEDITEAKQSIRDLEEANDVKAKFLASVSHEVRTPLTSIIAAAEFLMGSDLDPESARFVEIVHRNGQRLQDLVTDILDFSQLKSRNIVPRSKLFSVSDIIEGVAEWAVPYAEGGDLTFLIDVDESVPDLLLGDGPRIGQIVTNFVQNALKFTSEGSVELKTRVLDGATPEPRLEFSVTDTGVGIDEDKLAALFDPFTQGESGDTSSHRGVGLGLAICRDLIDLLDGELKVSSEIGVGSTFAFSVPVKFSNDEETA